jgi:hypothetical protein
MLEIFKSPDAVSLMSQFPITTVNFYEKCATGDGLFCYLTTKEVNDWGQGLLAKEPTTDAVKKKMPEVYSIQFKYDHTETRKTMGPTTAGGTGVLPDEQQLDFFILNEKAVPGVKTITLVRRRSKTGEQLPLSFFMSKTFTTISQDITAEQRAAEFSWEMSSSECFINPLPKNTAPEEANKLERNVICQLSERDTCYAEWGSVNVEKKEMKRPTCLRMYSTQKGDVIIAAFQQIITYGNPYDALENGKRVKKVKPIDIDFNLLRVNAFSGVFPSAQIPEPTKIAKKTL